jgi:hypothetical protein
MALGTPFEVFCWYYLGLTPQGEYRFVNGNRIAAVYNCSVGELLGFLKKNHLDPDTVLNTDFPMARHQVDVQLAAQERGPEHALELAERIFNEFQGRIGNRRDWLAEIEREREEDRQRRHS